MTGAKKTQLLHRLAIAEGHIKKVKQMIEEDAYCLDVIHQSRAVQASLKKIDEIVLQSHLNSCVLNDLPGSYSKKKKLADELVNLYSKNGS